MKKLSLLLVLVLLIGCTEKKQQLKSIEGTRISMTNVYDKNPNAKAVEVLKKYKHVVDSIASPILGYSEGCYRAFRPESPLSNLAADILYLAGQKRIKKHVDFAVTNIGGIRNDLLDGPITYGQISAIFPFINTLSIVEIDGKAALKLMHQIAARKGEAISHAKLVISKDKKLISATIEGKKIDPKKKYIVATINYLLEGNDGMGALSTGKILKNVDDLTVKQLVINYIKELQKEGKKVQAEIEGRIIIK
jgi:2',3'-cyclic-nucleotide 2'-phosphodiesterase (5'-nucleotidase family)